MAAMVELGHSTEAGQLTVAAVEADKQAVVRRLSASLASDNQGGVLGSVLAGELFCSTRWLLCLSATGLNARQPVLLPTVGTSSDRCLSALMPESGMLLLLPVPVGGCT